MLVRWKIPLQAGCNFFYTSILLYGIKLNSLFLIIFPNYKVIVTFRAKISNKALT